MTTFHGFLLSLFGKQTRDSVLKQVDGTLAPLIGAVVRGDLTSITTSCSLTNWKEALVSALTYCEDAQFTALAGRGGRIQCVFLPYFFFIDLLEKRKKGWQINC